MAGKLSENEIADLKERFKVMDVDGSGTVTTEEMRKVIGEALPGIELDVIAAMADTNGDGKLNINEFLQMAILSSMYV